MSHKFLNQDRERFVCSATPAQSKLTALAIACYQGNAEAVKLLLEHSAQRPYHHAMTQAEYLSTRRLLQTGHTPLMLLLQGLGEEASRADLCRYLLANQTQPMNLKDHQQCNDLALALLAGQFAAAEALLTRIKDKNLRRELIMDSLTLPKQNASLPLFRHGQWVLFKLMLDNLTQATIKEYLLEDTLAVGASIQRLALADIESLLDCFTDKYVLMTHLPVVELLIEQLQLRYSRRQESEVKTIALTFLTQAKEKAGRLSYNLEQLIQWEEAVANWEAARLAADTVPLSPGGFIETATLPVVEWQALKQQAQALLVQEVVDMTTLHSLLADIDRYQLQVRALPLESQALQAEVEETLGDLASKQWDTYSYELNRREASYLQTKQKQPLSEAEVKPLLDTIAHYEQACQLLASLPSPSEEQIQALASLREVLPDYRVDKLRQDFYQGHTSETLKPVIQTIIDSLAGVEPPTNDTLQMYKGYTITDDSKVFDTLPGLEEEDRAKQLLSQCKDLARAYYYWYELSKDAGHLQTCLRYIALYEAVNWYIFNAIRIEASEDNKIEMPLLKHFRVEVTQVWAGAGVEWVIQKETPTDKSVKASSAEPAENVSQAKTGKRLKRKRPRDEEDETETSASDRETEESGAASAHVSSAKQRRIIEDDDDDMNSAASYETNQATTIPSESQSTGSQVINPWQLRHKRKQDEISAEEPMPGTASALPDQADQPKTKRLRGESASESFFTSISMFASREGVNSIQQAQAAYQLAVTEKEPIKTMVHVACALYHCFMLGIDDCSISILLQKIEKFLRDKSLPQASLIKTENLYQAFEQLAKNYKQAVDEAGWQACRDLVMVFCGKTRLKNEPTVWPHLPDNQVRKKSADAIRLAFYYLFAKERFDDYCKRHTENVFAKWLTTNPCKLANYEASSQAASSGLRR